MRTFPGFDLSGKAVVVTGGGGHLGSAMSLACAELGAVVIACGRSAGPLERLSAAADELGFADRLVTAVGDIAEESVVEGLIARAIAEAGGLDGWVNNAYDGSGELLGDLDRSAVERTLSDGLANAILATKLAVAAMEPRKQGSVVNIASMYGLVSPQPSLYEGYPSYHNPPVYGAAKAGLIQFTRYVAAHVGAHQIRVNAVSPGPFPSFDIQSRSPGFISELRTRAALQRIGEPTELAGAVAFLLSDAARYITGHNLVVDGGWTTW